MKLLLGLTSLAAPVWHQASFVNHSVRGAHCNTRVHIQGYAACESINPSMQCIFILLGRITLCYVVRMIIPLIMCEKATLFVKGKAEKKRTQTKQEKKYSCEYKLTQHVLRAVHFIYRATETISCKFNGTKVIYVCLYVHTHTGTHTCGQGRSAWVLFGASCGCKKRNCGIRIASVNARVSCDDNWQACRVRCSYESWDGLQQATAATLGAGDKCRGTRAGRMNVGRQPARHSA